MDKRCTGELRETLLMFGTGIFTRVETGTDINEAPGESSGVRNKQERV